MLKKIKIKKGFIVAFFGVAVFSVIGFVEKKHAEKVCKKIFVKIDNETPDNYFVDENDIRDLVSLNGTDMIEGKKYENINLKTLELRIKSHKFVEGAQVYKDHEGNLMIEVQQCRPIGRIVQVLGPHAYIGSNGNTLPTSEKFTARVLVIDGDGAGRLATQDFLTTEEGKPYIELIKYIDEDKFWKAQIAQISVDKKGEMTMYTQVGGEVIVFGKPEEIEVKFKKLTAYYKEVIPVKGFNRYKTVNLKFKDQIVCE